MDSRCERGLIKLPVIRGPRWFGPAGGPFLARIEVPLSFEQVVAALHALAECDDLVGDEDLAGCVAVTLLLEGLPGLEARAARLREQEERGGAVGSPEFLACCRERVTALLMS